MTSDDGRKSIPRHPIIVRVFGYLTIQAFVLMLLIPLPWPVVDIYSFVHVRESVIPTPVWILYWAQVPIGLFLTLRGKVFLMGQFFLFATAFLLLAKTEHIPGRGDDAAVPSAFYPVYWIQFFTTTVAIISWRFRKRSIQKTESSKSSEQNHRQVIQEGSLTDEPNSPSNDVVDSEASQFRDGRNLAWLSLAFYLIGFVWVAKIAIFDRGLDAIFGAILVTIISMVSSIALAIRASFTYPRALTMLIVHAVTVALLFFAHWASRP